MHGLLETALFTLAVLALYDTGRTSLAILFAIMIIFSQILSFLLHQKPATLHNRVAGFIAYQDFVLMSNICIAHIAPKLSLYLIMIINIITL